METITYLETPGVITTPINEMEPSPWESSTTKQEFEPTDDIKEDTKPTPKSKKEDTIAAFAQKLISLSSCIHSLQTQSHLIHFNYEGEDFLAVHKFLKKEYELHQEQFDRVGEYVRSLNYLMPMCEKGLTGAHKKNITHVTKYEGFHMLVVYRKNLEYLGEYSKEIRKAAIKNNSPDIENYLAEIVDNCFKSVWMLNATLRDV